MIDAATGDDDEAAEPQPKRGGVRRLLPARDDRVPLYVQAYGATVGRDGDCLRVRRVAGKAVNRLGRDGDKFARHQQRGGLGNALGIGLQDAGFHAVT